MSIRKHGAAEVPAADVPVVEVEGGMQLSRTASGSQGWTGRDEDELNEENVASDEG